MEISRLLATSKGTSFPSREMYITLTKKPNITQALAWRKWKKEKHPIQSTKRAKQVHLGPAILNHTVLISEHLNSEDEEKLITYLRNNKDGFAWSSFNLGVSHNIIEHSLSINPSIHPKKQKLRKMSDKKIEPAKVEVHRLLEAKFVEPIDYSICLANIVMVNSKNGSWRMCIEFTILNKPAPRTPGA